MSSVSTIFSWSVHESSCLSPIFSPISTIVTDSQARRSTRNRRLPLPAASPGSPTVVRSRASRCCGRVRQPPVSAGSRRVGPQIYGSALVTTSASLTSVSVSQNVVVNVFPSPPASSSVSAASSPPSLVENIADSVKPERSAIQVVRTRLHPPNVPRRNFVWAWFDCVSGCVINGVESSIKHFFF